MTYDEKARELHNAASEDVRNLVHGLALEEDRRLEREAIEKGNVAEECTHCETEFTVTLKGARSRGFCSASCEHEYEWRKEEDTGCICRRAGRASCPFHGDPS